jgi:ABC-type uncharacterized transport system fused permease/ATPase subunit
MLNLFRRTYKLCKPYFGFDEVGRRKRTALLFLNIALSLIHVYTSYTLLQSRNKLLNFISPGQKSEEEFNSSVLDFFVKGVVNLALQSTSIITWKLLATSVYTAITENLVDKYFARTSPEQIRHNPLKASLASIIGKDTKNFTHYAATIVTGYTGALSRSCMSAFSLAKLSFNHLAHGLFFAKIYSIPLRYFNRLYQSDLERSEIKNQEFKADIESVRRERNRATIAGGDGLRRKFLSKLLKQTTDHDFSLSRATSSLIALSGSIDMASSIVSIFLSKKDIVAGKANVGEVLGKATHYTNLANVFSWDAVKENFYNIIYFRILVERLENFTKWVDSRADLGDVVTHGGKDWKFNNIVMLDSDCKHNGEHKLLDGLSFSFTRGGIYLLDGPVAAGKTTIMRLLLNFNLSAVESGSIVEPEGSMPGDKCYLSDVAPFPRGYDFNDSMLYRCSRDIILGHYGEVRKKMAANHSNDSRYLLSNFIKGIDAIMESQSFITLKKEDIEKVLREIGFAQGVVLLENYKKPFAAFIEPDEAMVVETAIKLLNVSRAVSVDIKKLLIEVGFEEKKLTQLAEAGAKWLDLGLSKGQKVLLDIVAAIMAKPKLLILDETLSALDEETVVKVKQRLAALDDTIIIYTLHNEKEEVTPPAYATPTDGSGIPSTPVGDVGSGSITFGGGDSSGGSSPPLGDECKGYHAIKKSIAFFRGGSSPHLSSLGENRTDDLKASWSSRVSRVRVEKGRIVCQ